MPLSTGDRLGRYEILSPLGAGGMGEVYRAHDERLDRDVAIKVLPDAVAQDDARLARFEREAKLLASLSHQNIATLYGLEEVDLPVILRSEATKNLGGGALSDRESPHPDPSLHGAAAPLAQDDSVAGRALTRTVRFLVMELAEGETLAERITKGAIPIDDALPIVLQIAEGLEAAHEQGIIHRDLKPANVMLSPEGKVKILDFGLAKAWHDEVSDVDLTHSPTLTAQMTAAGVLLGTAAYMSPEQARGKAVDRRADIWAFGVILFEMLTGRRLFDGETTSDVLAAVLRAEPDWSELPAGTPRPVVRLLHRCLDRDPRERLHDIADARLELRDAFPNGTVGSTQGRRQRGLSPAILAVVIPASLIVGCLVTWWLVGPRGAVGEGTRSARFELPLKDDQRVNIVSDDVKVAVAPDGRSIAWIGGSDFGLKVFTRSLDELEPRSLPGVEFQDQMGAPSLRFSPDSMQLAWVDGDTVWTSPVNGGVPNRVYRHSSLIWYVDWESTESLLIAPAHSGLFRLHLGEDRLEPITTLDPDNDEVAHERQRVLPDGRGVLMSVGVGNFHDCHIDVVDLDSGERRTVIEDASLAEFVDTGHLVFVRDGTVFAVPFDLQQLRTSGPPSPVFAGVQMDPGSGRIGQFAVSRSGVVAYVPDYGLGLSRMGWVDRAGHIEALRLDAGVYIDFRLSPTADYLAVTRSHNHSIQIELFDFERGVQSHLTTHGTYNNRPVWSPDGSRLAYGSNRDGQWNIFIADRGGDSSATRLAQSAYIQEPSDWSPDGRLLVYEERPTADRQDLWLLSTDGQGKPTPFATTPARELWASFSPDGSMIAYTVEEAGRYEVYMAPVPGSPDDTVATPIKVSRAGGLQPEWSPSGDELFYLSTDLRSILSVPVGQGPRRSIGGERVVLESIPKAKVWTFANFRVGADGERFLVMLESEQQQPQSLVVMTDWRKDLLRLGRD